jgi:hypothetical protein
MDLTAMGNACVIKVRMVLSLIGKYCTILNSNIIKGKNAIIIKKAACAEKAPI